MASADTGNNIIKNNNRLRGKSVSRYKKIRSLYLGGTEEETEFSNFSQLPNLSPEELIAGRKRAKAYYKKRNRRIWFQIIALFIGVIILVSAVFWYLI